MSIFKRGPSIDASYQVSVHLDKQFGCHRPFLFLIGCFLKKISSETARPIESKLGRKHPWKVLYQD
jgi:hypothetical protein